MITSYSFQSINVREKLKKEQDTKFAEELKENKPKTLLRLCR